MLAGGLHGRTHFVHRHVLDQLKRQQANERQAADHHHALGPAGARRGPDGQRQLEQFDRENGRTNRPDAEERHAHALRQADGLLVFPAGRQDDELHDRRHDEQRDGEVGDVFAFQLLPQRGARLGRVFRIQ